MGSYRSGRPFWQTYDWKLVFIYLALVFIGWVNIYASIHGGEQYHGHHIVIGPHGGFDVGLGMVHHALQTYGERDEHSARDEAEVGRVPPVEPVAIIEQPSHLQPQHTPQQRSHPVDALERNDLRHGMEGAT